MIDLRLGDYREVLAGVGSVDAVICDPPYSGRTDKGVRSGSTMQDQRNQVGMGYAPVDYDWCASFVDRWSDACGWMLICGDHITWQWWDRLASEAGRYVFPPVVIAKRGSAPRMCADGPASQCEYVSVSRPRSAAFVGSWPGIVGWYPMDTVRHGHGHAGVRGAKSLDLMRAIIVDYTRPGDLVCDPCAGGGTTLIAAAIEGRRAIGAEIDETTFKKAQKRIAAGFTPSLFTGQAVKQEQGTLI